MAMARRLLSNRFRLSTLRMLLHSPRVGALKVCSLATTTGAVLRHILKKNLTNQLTSSLMELLYVSPFHSKNHLPTGLISVSMLCSNESSLVLMMIFQNHQSQGALPALIRLQRQVSYFGIYVIHSLLDISILITALFLYVLWMILPTFLVRNYLSSL